MQEFKRNLNLFFSGYYNSSAVRRGEIVLRLGALLFLRKIGALEIKRISDSFGSSELIIKEAVSSDKVLCYNESIMYAKTKGDFMQMLEKQIFACMRDGDPDYFLEMGKFLIDWDVDGRGLLTAFDYTISYGLDNQEKYMKQPREITEVVKMLLDEKVKTVFDPFGGMMDFATSISDRRFVANEVSESIWELGMFRLALVDLLDKTEFNCKNSVDWVDGKFDAIVTNPPFGVKLRIKNNVFVATDAEELAFRYFNDTTTENGQLITVVPYSFLSSDNDMKVGMRELIVEHNWLDTVIFIPKQKRSVSYVDYAIVLLKKNRASDEGVCFIDASNCFNEFGGEVVFDELKVKELLTKQHNKCVVDLSREDVIDNNSLLLRDKNAVTVSREVIINNHSIWLPGYYLLLNSRVYRDGFEYVHFADVLEPVPAKRRFEETSGRFVDRISASVLQYEKSPNDFAVSKDLENTVKITEPVVFISQASAVFPMYCVASESEPVFARYSRGIKAYRIKSDKIHPGYLCTELFSRLVSLQGYVNFYLQLNKRILELLPLSFPSFEKDDCYQEQQKLYEVTKEANQSAKVRELGLQKTIDDLVAESKKQFRARKHSLMQNSVSLAADWQDLKDYLLANDGRFDVDDTIGMLNPIKIGEIINSISENIKIMENKIYHLTDEDIDWGQAEEIDLQDFIKEYINSHRTARYRFEFVPKLNVNLESADQTGIVYCEVSADWKVLISKKALLQVFDDIVSNARDHGFVDERNGNYAVKFDFTYNFDSIVLEISNNGKALGDGVDTEYIKTNGSSTKLNVLGEDGNAVHSGLGGYEIDSILKKYNATMEVLSAPDAMYTVTYRIVFKDIKDTIVRGEVPDF